MAETNVDATTPKITFADLGIPQAEELEHNVTGPARKLSDIDRHEKMYIVCMLLAITAMMGLTVYRLTQVSEENPDFAFCLVLVLNSLFCIFYVFDGIKRERPSELLLLSAAITLMSIYLLVNYLSGKQADIKLARMVAGCVLSIPLVCYGLYLAHKYNSEGRLIFRVVGANSLLQKLLNRLCFLQDMLKFDLELQLTLIILMLGSRVNIDTVDIVILSVGIPFSIVWVGLGYYGFTKESRPVVISFFVLSTPGIAYLGYKMYHLSKYIDAYPGLASATIACIVISFIVRVAIILLGVVVYRKFGHGLNPGGDATPIPSITA